MRYSPSSGYSTVHLDLFFRQPDGQAWHPTTISRRFTQYAQEAGLPPCSIHDGRHASASYTIAAGGTIKDVKEQPGGTDGQAARLANVDYGQGGVVTTR